MAKDIHPDASTAGYRVLTYREKGRPTAGVLVAGRVYPAQQMLQGTAVDASSVMSLLQSWPRVQRALAKAARRVAPERGAPLGRIRLLAPILFPRGIFCAGANYWDHAKEMGGSLDSHQRPTSPWFFLKTSAHSVVGDRARVQLPPKTRQLDWEAELAVVIGKRAHNVRADRALEVIAGYTILNDLSARDLMMRADRPPAMAFDWIGQKCFDGAAPMGPWITPADFVPDCHRLAVNLWVNGGLKQSSNTDQLIHTVFEQIEWLSHQLTLLPGDVIATGTPAGVGAARGEYLSKGDVVTIELESCGRLTNTIV